MIESINNKALSPNLDAILSAIGDRRHTLHLYSSGVNKYAIQAPFLGAVEKGDTVYVTCDDPKIVKRAFGGLNARLIIIRPEELGKVLVGDRSLRVLVDVSSIDPSELGRMECRTGTTIGTYIDHLRREKYLTESCGPHTILCTYDMGKLTPELVRQLAPLHDKLVLTTSDATLLAAESLDRAGISQEVFHRFVKDELESIILALLLREPLCGLDIIKLIHNNFGVLLSPGTIYPLLHDLEKRGLLKCKYGVKMKTYKPAEGAEEKIRKMLEEHVMASSFLSRFLQMTGVGGRTLNVRTSTNKV